MADYGYQYLLETDQGICLSWLLFQFRGVSRSAFTVTGVVCILVGISFFAIWRRAKNGREPPDNLQYRHLDGRFLLATDKNYYMEA